MTKAEQDAVAETVKANAEADAESNDVYDMEVTIAGQNIDCGRRLSGYHRQLPSGLLVNTDRLSFQEWKRNQFREVLIWAQLLKTRSIEILRHSFEI
jgi:hypothetical protein